jgi:ankyrin repeat protein
MNTNSIFSRFCHSRISHRVGAVLAALTLCGLVACAKKHDSLNDAAKSGDLAKVRQLLKSNPGLVSSQDTNGCTPLFNAALYGHDDVVELLLANKADVNAKTRAGLTPLMFAVHTNIARLLLDRGADVNARDNRSRWTALHLAAAFGRTNMVELLLANGADVNVVDVNGRAPLYYAECHGHADVAELLRQHGGKDTMITEFIDAVKGGDLEKVKKLIIYQPALVGIVVSGHTTPLHLAAQFGHKDVAGLLLDNTADVNAKDINGKTPLVQAEQSKHQDVADLLRQHGGQE